MADIDDICLTSSVFKKRTVETSDRDSDKIFNKFFNEYPLFDSFINKFETVLSCPGHALLPSVISSCDADCLTFYGRPFDRCECIAHANAREAFHFGTFFIHGTRIFDSLKSKTMPENILYKKAAARLLNYVLQDTEWHEELDKVTDSSYVLGETQVMVTLAEHLFNRLATPCGYVIAKHASKADICRCGKCGRDSLTFDDTSIGNNKVWHGRVDILFESCEVAVKCYVKDNKEGEDNTTEDHSRFEIQETGNLDEIQPRSQAIAQTIVFSLLQKQRNPSWEHFLIPSIIANNKTLKIFFYDADNDILLESKKYDFVWEKSGNLPARIRLETIIAVWLVLNYKLLCTGPYPEYVQKAPKSLFKKFTKNSQETYENGLRLRNVFTRELPQKAFSSWDRMEDECQNWFVWPASLYRPNFDVKVFGKSS